MAWNTAGVLSAPTTGTILADTGALGATTLSFTILLYALDTCTIDIQHRNATNTTTLHSQLLYVTPGTNNPMTVTIQLTPGLNERLRVVAASDFYSDGQVSILS